MAEDIELNIMTNKFVLPEPIADLISARNKLRALYHHTDLKFTIDENLVGDIGEAIATKVFKLDLVSSNRAAIDATAVDGRSVQIKATGTNRGPAFRMTEKRADHLLFFNFDFENLIGEVIYNGPEENVIRLLPDNWTGQRAVSMKKIMNENAGIHESQRLPFSSIR